MKILKYILVAASICVIASTTLIAQSLTKKDLNRLGNERFQKNKPVSFAETIKELRKHDEVIDLELNKTEKAYPKLPPVKQFSPKAVDSIRGEIKRKTPFVKHETIQKRLENLDEIDGKPVPKKLSDKIEKSVVVPEPTQNDIFKGKTIKVKEKDKRTRPVSAPKTQKKKRPSLWQKITLQKHRWSHY